MIESHDKFKNLSFKSLHNDFWQLSECLNYFLVLVSETSQMHIKGICDREKLVFQKRKEDSLSNISSITNTMLVDYDKKTFSFVATDSMSIALSDTIKIRKEQQNQELMLYISWGFEEYEKFLRKIYNSNPKKISEKSNCGKILSELRKEFTAIDTMEQHGINSNLYSFFTRDTQNHYCICNLRLDVTIAYLTQLRHICVHNRGNVSDSFEEKIKNKNGLSGDVVDQNIDFLNSRLLTTEGDVRKVNLFTFLTGDSPDDVYAKTMSICRWVLDLYRKHAFLIVWAMSKELFRDKVDRLFSPPWDSND